MTRQLLSALGLTTNVQPFHPRTRDREDIRVAKDLDSGIIFLSSFDHITDDYYEDHHPSTTMQMRIDDDRRIEQFKTIISDTNLLDFGSGAGGFADSAYYFATSITSVDPCNTTSQFGRYKTLPDAVHCGLFDVITMFHVLEHLTDPIGTLKELYDALVPGGKLIIEVPHAQDFLLEFEHFRDNSLWSEHLILHTAKSLRVFLKAAGFNTIGLTGYQRYDYMNHVGWGVDIPLGPDDWKARIHRNHLTDTLIAIATK